MKVPKQKGWHLHAIALHLHVDMHLAAAHSKHVVCNLHPFRGSAREYVRCRCEPQGLPRPWSDLCCAAAGLHKTPRTTGLSQL